MGVSYSIGTAATYKKIYTTTLSGTASSVTISNIPQNFTDLVLVCNGQVGATDNPVTIQFNGDTSSNYSATEIRGNGSSAGSTRTSNNTAIYPSWVIAPGTSDFSWNMTVHFMNYTNGNVYKTALSRANCVNGSSSSGTEATVGLWRSLSPITSIKIFLSATSFVAGSTFTLYGIAAAPITPTPKATGGLITFDNTYAYHTFTSTGTFTPLQSLTCDYLIVAGGGGSPAGGGGGGAGGLRAFANQSFSATGYLATVGAGGTAGTSTGATETNGNTTSFFSTSVSGGGNGGNYHAVGGNGGSGGGGGPYLGSGYAGGSGNAGSYSPVEGYAGGSGSGGGNTDRGGGGGGGAGGGGSGASAGTGGAGGAGTNSYNSISFASWLSTTKQGVSGYLAGGGGGLSQVASSITPAAGGIGGGGTGSLAVNQSNTTSPTDGWVNTGGGAGGGTAWGNGANGGSGLVIVRYAL